MISPWYSGFSLVQISFIASICSRNFFEAGLAERAVVFHLLDVPPAADAENKAPARDLVERGNELRRLDRIALDREHTPVASFSRLVNAAALVSRGGPSRRNTAA